jgi:hypothetical protein
MGRTSSADELNILYDSLLPVLARAAIGDYSSAIELDRSYSPRVNELLTGVQVLLEAIREKIDELEAANADLVDSRDRSLSLVDEMLRKSLE